MRAMYDFLYCYKRRMLPIDILVNEIDGIFLKKKDEGIDFELAILQAFLNIAEEQSK